jgi:hypothetical protein
MRARFSVCHCVCSCLPAAREKTLVSAVQVCEKDIMMIKQLGAGACATVGAHYPGHSALVTSN